MKMPRKSNPMSFTSDLLRQNKKKQGLTKRNRDRLLFKPWRVNSLSGWRRTGAQAEQKTAHPSLRGCDGEAV
jgi:hypothetical protein